MENTPFLYTDEIELFIDALPDNADETFLTKATDLFKKCMAYIDTAPEALYNTLFLKAIIAHYQPQAALHEHIYLQQYEIPQIVLFDILVNKLPFVTFSHTIVNSAISDMLGASMSAVIIDIGVGRGIQMVRLIDALSGNTNLKELTIIGVEPFQPAIDHAMQLIANKKAAFKITFIPVVSFIEHLKYKALKKLIPEHEKLIVNASLVLHHLQSANDRKAFFNLIASLDADAIVLTEPYSDHMTADWKQRVRNAYVHYGSVFSMIDNLSISIPEKNGLKMFFGREIDDIIGNPEDQRFERHERAEKWIAYLIENNFMPQKGVNVPDKVGGDNVVFHQDDKGFLTMKYKSVDVLSIITGKHDKS